MGSGTVVTPGGLMKKTRLSGSPSWDGLLMKDPWYAETRQRHYVGLTTRLYTFLPRVSKYCDIVFLDGSPTNG